MKFVKRISLFFIYPLVVFGLGFYAGVECMHFFYPGEANLQKIEEVPEQDWSKQIVEQLNAGDGTSESAVPEVDEVPLTQFSEQHGGYNGEISVEIADVDASGETLSVDTEYVLEETDIINHSVVETVWKLPSEYIGLNREQFLTAMEEYEAFPPLSELERGFVSLEVLSFSRERVVVQMNYQYVQPGNSFYLAVRDNEVVVYLEDMETVYINTGIRLEDLPQEVQLEIIQMLWIEDEDTLYHFLENYSS